MTTRIFGDTWLFLKYIGQALFSMLFNFAGLAAGILVAYNLGIFDKLPWAIIIYPGILSIRGAIGGLYSGRISTALHIGTVKPSIFNNTPYAYSLFNTVNALTLISALMMGSIGSIFSILAKGLPYTELFSILSVVIASMGLSIISISPLTFWVSVISFRRGLDPDVLVYPVVSTIADIIITTLYIGLLYLVTSVPGFSWGIIGGINVFFVAYIIYSVKGIYRTRDFISTVREFVLTLLLVSVIVNITGTVLSSITELIGRRPEVLMIYPAMIDTVGDVGSIIGSTATTKMALGIMATEFKAIFNHLREICSAVIASLVMFLLYSLMSSVVFGLDSLPRLIGETYLTHLLVVPLIIVISFSIAIIARRRGLDPDNMIIPIETSLSDGLTTISLLITLIII